MPDAPPLYRGGASGFFRSHPKEVVCILRLLLGGSPCQRWSIGQTRNRETEPSGIGWELFRNYLIARQKYQPDFFLYENNKSMAKAVREQITAELGVEPICINSALVSAQNRQRLYWTNIPGVEQPEDRGIYLQDILESGTAWLDKSYCLTATEYKGVSLEHHLTHHVRNLAAEPVTGYAMRQVGRKMNERGHRDDDRPRRKKIQRYEVSGTPDKASCLTTIQKHNLVAIPVVTESEPQSMELERRKHIFEVRDGMITVKDRRYPIRLPDGLYLIRNLTVRECMRLQTVPEDYLFPVSRSRALALLGNGWTVQVISHILSYCPGIRTEPMEVLSMYDGMSCGRLALRELGADVIRYYATEIDPYAIATTQANFPDTIQLGDAFQVRDDNWTITF